MINNVIKPDTSPDMWVHWVSTYFVDPRTGSDRCTTASSTAPGRRPAYYKNPEVDALLREGSHHMPSRTGRRCMRRLSPDHGDSPDIWIYNSMQLAGHQQPVKGAGSAPWAGVRRCAGYHDFMMLSFRPAPLRAGGAVTVGLLILTFVLIRVIPSDPARGHGRRRRDAGADPADPPRYGLDRPIWSSSFVYAAKAVRLDFGESRLSPPVALDISQRLPPRWS